MGARYTRKSLSVIALHWDGQDTSEFETWLGLHWSRPDAVGVADDGEKDLAVYDPARKQWELLPSDWWVTIDLSAGVVVHVWPPDTFAAAHQVVNS